jgi:hypothetical protein
MSEVKQGLEWAGKALTERKGQLSWRGEIDQRTLYVCMEISQ